MGRKKVIAGNWKMHLTCEEAIKLVTTVCEGLKEKKLNHLEVVFCPPFPYLPSVFSILSSKGIGKLGAQNLHWEREGAYTGEVSAKMLRSTGCSYVIVGHSERRAYFHEDEKVLQRKLLRAWEENLIPIYCIGETLEEREKGKTEAVLAKQLSVFLDIDLQEKKWIIAYEPVWAIGTGKPATPEMANEVHNFIRNWLDMNVQQGLGENITILYGGSVKPNNALSLFQQPEIDGALVGGASIKSDEFLAIVDAMVVVEKTNLSL